MDWRRSAEALGDQRFRSFFIARTISRIGSSMAPVALAFAVLHVDSRASALGTVLTGRTLATVVFVLLGGVIADRFRRRRVIQGSYGVTMLTQGTVAALILTDHATIGTILALECVNGAASAFTGPSMQGLLPQLITPRLLQQADALMAFSNNGTKILGPVIAGLLVVGPGAGWALAIDALSYAVAIAVLTRIRLPNARRGRSSMVADLRQGWAEFRSHDWLWVIVVAFCILNAVEVGAWSVLGPYIAKHDPDLGIDGWGLVLGAEATGAVVMTVVLMHWRLRHPLRAGMLGISLSAIPLCVLGLTPMTAPLMVLAALAGAGSSMFGTGWNVAMMEQIRPEALSRVYSYDMLGSFIAIPVGTACFGWLPSVADPRDVLVVSAIGYLTISLACLLLPSIRALGRRDAVAPEPA